MTVRVVFFSLLLFFVACSQRFSPFPKTEEHIVGSGDTLYSIAFEHDLDYRKLAHWNAINPPYKIYTGQMLVLHGYHPLAKRSDDPDLRKASQEKPREQKVTTRPVTSGEKAAVREIEVRPAPPPAPPAPVPVPTVTPSKDSEPKPEPARQPREEVQVAKAEPVKPIPPPVVREPIPKYDDPWIWPVKGEILERFSATNKGIDIGGKVGTPIRATAGGKVVYAGEGLKGYGLLLIIKHDQDYLSAYGHNERLLVVQGEAVQQGQPIATLGRGPESRPMLHFELRKNGKPVNPESMLPK